MTLAFVAAFVLVTATVGPVLAAALSHLAGPGERLRPSAFAAALLVVGVYAAVSERIGLHLVFGPLVLGIVVARTAPEGVRAPRMSRAERPSLPLLPSFFALPGLLIDFGAVAGSDLLALWRSWSPSMREARRRRVDGVCGRFRMG